MDRPNILRRSIMLAAHIWRRVMNVKFNPLKHIPDNTLQSYFMLVLFTIWSITFGFIATYYIGWLGYSTITSVVVHCAPLRSASMKTALVIIIGIKMVRWTTTLVMVLYPSQPM